MAAACIEFRFAPLYKSGGCEGWVVVPVPVLPEGGVETGAVPVVGLALLGRQGLATVADVPLGGVPAPATVELPVPAVVLVLPVDVPGVLVEGVLPDAVVPLLEGVQGATVEDVPLCVVPMVPPVVEPALPATPGVPWVVVGEPVVLLPDGGDV
ncbi:MAG TPA: hypothetical protein VGK24_12825 [Candidatus Angelobacter sp.]|jgi:hypothetical protein